MPQTTYNKYTHPNDTQEPYYDAIQSFWREQDTGIWFGKMAHHTWLTGGGTLSFDNTTGLFSWTADFVVPIMTSGFVTQFRFGPDGINREANLQSGQILYGTIPLVITDNAIKNLIVDEKIPHTDGAFPIAFRWGANLYMRNGQVL